MARPQMPRRGPPWPALAGLGIVAALPGARADVPQAFTQVSLGSSIPAFAAYAALAVALLVLGMVMQSAARARRQHQELLVLMLTLNAVAGVTPDSPEFVKAHEAVNGKPKPGKADRRAARAAARAASRAAKKAAKPAKA